jgi:radical SAM protein with 4Fe4S-binding SPASM domain
MDDFDRFYADSKLLAHMERLDEFSRTGHTKPIQAYLELTNVCNHNCPGCIGFRYDEKATMSSDQAKRVVDELKECGVEAILLSGGGDPTCYPNLRGVLEHIADKGMQAGLITNGQKLSQQDIESIVRTCEFVRISIDADSPETHKITHGMAPFAYEQIMKNVDSLVKIKREMKSNVTIGYSYLFGAFSAGNLYKAAKEARDKGVDYVRFKPFFTLNPNGHFVKLIKMEGEKAETIFAELTKAKDELQTDSFFVSYPSDRTEYQLSNDKSEKPRARGFNLCYVPHFFVTITPDMKVYPCCILKNNEKYLLGDLNQNSLMEIWQSNRTKNIHNEINFSDCPNPCQFDAHGRLLYELKRPQRHHNFL